LAGKSIRKLSAVAETAKPTRERMRALQKKKKTRTRCRTTSTKRPQHKKGCPGGGRKWNNGSGKKKKKNPISKQKKARKRENGLPKNHVPLPKQQSECRDQEGVSFKHEKKTANFKKPDLRKRDGHTGGSFRISARPSQQA